MLVFIFFQDLFELAQTPFNPFNLSHRVLFCSLVFAQLVEKTQFFCFVLLTKLYFSSVIVGNPLTHPSQTYFCRLRDQVRKKQKANVDVNFNDCFPITRFMEVLFEVHNMISSNLRSKVLTQSKGSNKRALCISLNM